MRSDKKPIDFALPLRHFVGIVFFFVIAVTCVQVISRYVFHYSLIWSEESVRFSPDICLIYNQALQLKPVDGLPDGGTAHTQRPLQFIDIEPASHLY